MLVAIDRCRNRENLDSCERFYDYKIDNYCKIVNTYTPMWGPFFESYEPRWTCPIKKVRFKH